MKLKNLVCMQQKHSVSINPETIKMASQISNLICGPDYTLYIYNLKTHEF